MGGTPPSNASQKTCTSRAAMSSASALVWAGVVRSRSPALSTMIARRRSEAGRKWASAVEQAGGEMARTSRSQLGQVREVGNPIGGGRLERASGAGVDAELSRAVEETEQLDRGGLLVPHCREGHVGGRVDHQRHVELADAEVLHSDRSGPVLVDRGECGGGEDLSRQYLRHRHDNGGRAGLTGVQRNDAEGRIVVGLRRGRDCYQRDPEHGELRR